VVRRGSAPLQGAWLEQGSQAGLLFIPVWLFDEICIVHLPGTNSGAKAMDVAVRIHGADVVSMCCKSPLHPR
jgi:hypothetical protein